MRCYRYFSDIWNVGSLSRVCTLRLMFTPRGKGRPPSVSESRPPTPARGTAQQPAASASSPPAAGSGAAAQAPAPPGDLVFDRQTFDATVSAADVEACRAKALQYLPSGVVPTGQWRWMANDLNVKRYLVMSGRYFHMHRAGRGWRGSCWRCHRRSYTRQPHLHFNHA